MTVYGVRHGWAHTSVIPWNVKKEIITSIPCYFLVASLVLCCGSVEDPPVTRCPQRSDLSIMMFCTVAMAISCLDEFVPFTLQLHARLQKRSNDYV